MTKILIVDDEPALVEFLRRLFGNAGYETVSASDGVGGLREFFVLHPYIAIIDLLMPKMDGFELCRRIREISHIPLVVLTGVEQIEEKVEAFSAGADDYVTKPVSGRELIARVEACLRRSHLPPTAGNTSIYSDRLVMVDYSRREVYVSGERKELTPFEYSLLSLLVQRPGEALSLEYLLTKVWGEEYDTFDLVKWHISNLRKKISNGYHESRQDGPSPIVTIRGYGYRYQRPSL